MAAIRISSLILTYALIALFLHPLLCQVSATPTTKQVHTATSDDLLKRCLCSGKAVDQSIAYVLMLIALLVTYLLH
ncbi:hypothetical protein ZIOFF_029803 [Zingiber officinale]|uniref:Uncharacterized protein n=1 Tax=Zingiber officinale TaxID=94328 RepID=A0A8J5GX90_ZINOF|nr:hypothetical protein ZIOFF_029803 [Zingiber officinale]